MVADRKAMRVIEKLSKSKKPNRKSFFKIGTENNMVYVPTRFSESEIKLSEATSQEKRRIFERTEEYVKRLTSPYGFYRQIGQYLILGKNTSSIKVIEKKIIDLLER